MEENFCPNYQHNIDVKRQREWMNLRFQDNKYPYWVSKDLYIYQTFCCVPYKIVGKVSKADLFVKDRKKYNWRYQLVFTGYLSKNNERNDRLVKTLESVFSDCDCWINWEYWLEFSF